MLKNARDIAKALPEVRKITNLFSSNRYETEPQRAYMFEITILEDGIKSVTQLYADLAKFYAKSLSIPKFSVDTITMPYLKKKFLFAGKDSSDHLLTVTFWDDEAFSIYNYMRDWYKRLDMPYTGQGLHKSNYTRSIQIKMKDTTDIATTKKIELKRAFPTEIGEVQLSYESGNIVEFSVTFAYDEMVDN